MVPHGLLNLWRAIRSSVQELRPDIVHLHSSLAGGVGRLTFGLRGKPAIVYSPHCFAFEMRDISRARRWAYRCAEFVLARRTAAFVCVSPYEAGLASQLGSRAKVFQVLNSFAPSRTEPTNPATPAATRAGGAADVPIRVVTVGRVAPQKDPEMFLQIVTALRASGCVEATWVGDGDGPSRAAMEISDVAVTGWLRASEVPAAIAGHTAYIHTARWEAAVPIAVLEAMAAGLPIAVRRNPAYQSMLPDEWQFDDVSSAVRMIHALADESLCRQRVREQSNVLVDLRKNSPDIVLAGAYRQILRRSGLATRVEASGVPVNRPGIRYGDRSMEDSRWAHRSSAS
jgi:glycosyltransferase involved in cell wall biosynthesis